MKISPILFAFLLLLQGCTLYKGSITLDEAVKGQKRVKVTTTESPKPYEFKRIEFINGKYKGIPKRYDQSGDVIVKKETITEIKEYDKTGSNIVIFAPLALIIGLGIILFTSGRDGGIY